MTTRFAPMRRLFADLLAPAALGALVTLGFAPWNIYPATIAALIGVLALWRSVGPGRAAWRGFVFGAAHFGTGLYWVYVAVHDHAGANVVLAGLATGALVVYLACFPALTGAIAGATNRFAPTLWALVVVPGAWCLAELLRGWAFTGFPWLSLGYVTIAAPLNGLAPLVGVHGLSLALMIAAGTLWLLYAGTLWARLVALVLIALLPLLVWSVPSPAHWTRPLHKTLQVAVLQGDIAPANQWRPALFAPTLRRYRDMTQRTDAALVVWPELAMPVSATRVDGDLAPLNAEATRRGQTVLAGLFWPTRDHRHLYNSVLALGADRGRYDKRHLVPFGEIVPGPSWLERLIGGDDGHAVAGAPAQPLIHAQGTALGVSIGFEDVFGDEIRRDLPAAQLLVNITNDGWFAGTTALAQHLEIARMRALESGRPLVRAANAGISAMIGFDGRLLHVAPAGQRARLLGALVPRAGATPYVAYGNRPLWWASAAVVLLALLGSGALAWQTRRQRRRDDRRRTLRERI
ncbi:apolipoprotein N-acyltransferase [Salinisphaera hydrothermalis]|uniref:apolipoprotein N-acyltransferase n=1 Tax=Salinisphaera hydrothermalis TaxID=563188 RepID=UPI00333F6783